MTGSLLRSQAVFDQAWGSESCGTGCMTGGELTRDSLRSWRLAWRSEGDFVTVWTVIAFAAVAAAVVALLAPHARTSSSEVIRLFGLQAVDSAASCRAATRVVTPLAVLSITVSLIGLAMNGGGPGSGVTSLIALLLAGAALAAGHVAALSAKKASTSE
jgi:hypothetical protein